MMLGDRGLEKLRRSYSDPRLTRKEYGISRRPTDPQEEYIIVGSKVQPYLGVALLLQTYLITGMYIQF